MPYPQKAILGTKHLDLRRRWDEPPNMRISTGIGSTTGCSNDYKDVVEKLLLLHKTKEKIEVAHC